MTAQLIAKFADLAIMISAGVVAILIGRRVIGPKPGISEKYDTFHGKWGKRFRWLGPFIIVFTLFKFGASLLTDNMSWMMAQQKGQQDLQASLASKGKLASRDMLVTAQEGFMIMVPAGYTYTTQPNKLIALFAIAGSNGMDNQVIGVSVSPADGSLEHGIENVKSVLAGKNPTYRFSETQTIVARIRKFYRIYITLQRDGVNMKGGMVFFEREGKVYSLTYSARELTFDANADTFERVVRSFAPTISSQTGMKKPSMACANEVRAAAPILLRAGMHSPEETHGGMRTQALFELVIGPSGQILQVNIAQPSDNKILNERTQQELARVSVTLPACAQDGSYWLTVTF